MSAADSPVEPGSEGEVTAVARVAEEDGIVILALQGEHDLFSAPQIVEQATHAIADRQHLILDLSEATFIDSCVVRALFQIYDIAGAHGCTCVLQLGTAAIVGRVLKITAVEQTIPRAHTRADAVHLIREHRAFCLAHTAQPLCERLQAR
jgi:anti-sigma B factor antagonist